MADEIDIANDRAQEILDERLRYRHRPGPKAVGHCLCCGAPCRNRWCGADCRNEWEYDQQRLNARGNAAIDAEEAE